MKSLAAALLVIIAVPAFGEQASVDFGSTIRPLSHAGSGVLHSISATTPNDSLLAPIKPSTFRGPSAGPGYDRSIALGADYQLVMADFYSGAGTMPGDNDDWTAWEATCRAVAAQVLAQGNEIQIDIWNEPDQPSFWPRSQAQYLETWKRGVNAIREVNPNATIVGPSTSVYWWHTNLNVEQVLTYAKANDVLPDIISWHSWDRNLTNEIDQVRQFAAANDIDASRISINEYLWWFDQYRSGPVVHFLDAIEKKNVESGIKSCWNTCSDNSLDGLVDAGGQPRSNWWLYERYGRMTGSSVMTVSGGDTLDVVASQDDGVAYALVGRYKDSYVAFRDSWTVVNHPDVVTPGEVLLQNLDDVPLLVFGDKVHVLAELIKNSDSAASSGPVVMIDADFTTINGQLTLSLPNFGTFDAYFLTITAVAGMPGDFNHDGAVDAADYVVLRDKGGSSFAADYAIWRSNFGAVYATGTGTADASVVPEAGTVALLAIALATCASSTRRLRPLQL